MENPRLPVPARDNLPPIESIKPEHAEPAIDAVLAESRARLDALLA
jgi:oligopeptidase A